MKNQPEYSVDLTKDLNDLFKRLKSGDIVRGRILHKLCEGKYIVRIFGYNIITGSTSKLLEGNEVDLKVKQTNGHLLFELISDLTPKGRDNKHLNIIA